MSEKVNDQINQVNMAIKDIERDGFIRPQATAVFILKVILFILVEMGNAKS